MVGRGLLTAVGLYPSLFHPQPYSQEFHIKFWDVDLGQVPILETIIVVREMNYVNWPGSPRLGSAHLNLNRGRRMRGLVIQGKSRCGHQTRRDGCWVAEETDAYPDWLWDYAMKILVRLGFCNHISSFDTRCGKIVARTFINFLSRPTNATHPAFCLPFPVLWVVFS